MVSVGYGPGDLPETDVPDECSREEKKKEEEEEEQEHLVSFARNARVAMGDKFKRAGAQVPAFLDCVHTHTWWRTRSRGCT